MPPEPVGGLRDEVGRAVGGPDVGHQADRIVADLGWRRHSIRSASRPHITTRHPSAASAFAAESPRPADAAAIAARLLVRPRSTGAE